MRTHVIVLTSTALYPSDNGWPYRYCRCNPEDAVCAAWFDHEDDFDYEGYRAALTAFQQRHPKAQAVESKWAQ
jgi:hypothetical protein